MFCDNAKHHAYACQLMQLLRQQPDKLMGLLDG